MNTTHPDGCDRCGKHAQLYHNEATGLALCDRCDLAADVEAMNEHERDIPFVAEPATIETVPVEPELPPSNVLMERETAGLKVEVCWVPILDMATLRVTYDGREAHQRIDKASALDAFDHPVLYLLDEQLAELAIR